MFAVTGNTLDPDHLSKFGATDRTLLWNAELLGRFHDDVLAIVLAGELALPDLNPLNGLELDHSHRA